MKGILYQRRNSKSSQSGESNKIQSQEQPQKFNNIQQMNEQLQKLRQQYQQSNLKTDQIANSSNKKIQFQESPSKQDKINQNNSPYSINSNKQIQNQVNLISAAPPSNMQSFKSLEQMPATHQQQQEIKDLQQKIHEYAQSNQMLIERNAILENDLLLQRSQNNVLQHSNSHSNGVNSLNNTVNSINIDRQLQAALIEKLRLEEIIEFMKEENDKTLEELNIYKSKSDSLEKELKDTSQTVYQNQNQVQAFYSQNKKIEDQLKLSNIHFVNAQKKLSLLEKENKDLNEKLNFLEQEKKKISQKWHAASQNRKQEEKLKQRVKELEVELNEKSIECEEFKKKYVSTNTELRVYKEGEFNYKDVVENKFKELKTKWQEEIRQKDELLKQNNELLSQLEQFSQELQNLQQKCEKLQDEKCDIQQKSQSLQQQNEQLQILAVKKEISQGASQSVQLTRDELTKRLQQANQEITSLIKQNEESNQQILILQQDKHIMNKQIEEFLKQNEQLQDAINALLSENQQEQELLSHLTSKNIHGSGSKNHSTQQINVSMIQQKELDQEFQQSGIEKQKDKKAIILESEEYQKLIQSVESVNDETITEEIKQKIEIFVQYILFSATQNKDIGEIFVCNTCKQSCQNQNSNNNQKGFEKQYYEIKHLYDRLLIKYYNVQKKFQILEESGKIRQTGNLNSSFQINKNLVNQISPQEGSFEELHEQKSLASAYKSGAFLINQQKKNAEINDSFESIKQISSNQLNQNYINHQQTDQPLPLSYQIQQQSDLRLREANQQDDLQNINNSHNYHSNSTLNKSYNFTSALNSTNTNLIQNILKNDFNIKETLSENSQKMLNTILNKFLNTQGLNSSQLLNQSQQYKNSKSFGNLNETNSTGRLINNSGVRGTQENNQIINQVKSGPPTRTLERSLLRRNKSKENYHLNNSSGNLNNTSHNTSNNVMLNQSVDAHQRRYQEIHLNNLFAQQNKNASNGQTSYASTPYTNILKQRKNSNSYNQVNGTPSSTGGGYQSIHQLNRSFDGCQQSGSKGSNSSYSKFIKRKTGQNYQNNNNMSNYGNNQSGIKNNVFTNQQQVSFVPSDQQNYLQNQNKFNEFQYHSVPQYRQF
ncbi:hypothetical protein TTHERM_00079170 (macronuclear) [Tetrahymena thermophila SB210]|uniref:Uncharacterized protein n=1 Tax=Tetrahymena thermophila (strain SB210) TaxID=312017 RepID=Q23FU7_TETTS|nr:hypothetical protein TTHERM_00079170 [Tetrahymena thermophila SB210]EAR95513.2 hypothetical protein TTHERM_00079170 [Tetrahymena thermophila SB210]|eukprot:XP_001015758.2 hypothetical protein TTHERM_00079170 [Tetrahymena thermophila SB210]